MRNEFLFDLIKSLTVNEKRYFKLFATLQKGNKNYLKLFDAIDCMDEYNESKLKQDFRREAFVKQFPVAKNYLYKMILRSIRNFSTSEVDSSLRAELEYAHILFNKGLYDQSMSVIKRIKKNAVAYEIYDILLSCQVLEKRIFVSRSYVGMSEEEIEKSFEEEDEVMDNFFLGVDISRVSTRIFMAKQKLGPVRTKKEIDTYKNIKGIDLLFSFKPKTPKAKMQLHHTRFLYFSSLGDYKQTLIEIKEVYNIMEANPHFKDIGANAFIMAGSNYLYAMIQNNQLEKFPQVLGALKNFTTTSPDTKLKVQTRILNLELLYYIKTGNFKDANAAIQEAEKMLAVERNLIENQYYIILNHHLAQLYFGFKEYDKTIEYSNNIISFKDKRFMLIQSSAKILSALAHFETKSDILLPHLLRSTSRYLQSKERLLAPEKLILKFLKKASDKPVGNIKSGFLSLRKEISAIRLNDLDSNALYTFDLLSYLESKILNKDFLAVVASKNSLKQ